MPQRDNRRRKDRSLLSEKKAVMVSSIGSDIRYHLETKNVSVGGLFLEHTDPERLPFTEASIIEVWFEASEKNVIFFNAKVARKVLKDDDDNSGLWGPGVGIRIIQISKENSEKLGAYLKSETEKEKQSSSSDHSYSEKVS